MTEPLRQLEEINRALDESERRRREFQSLSPEDRLRQLNSGLDNDLIRGAIREERPERDDYSPRTPARERLDLLNQSVDAISEDQKERDSIRNVPFEDVDPEFRYGRGTGTIFGTLTAPFRKGEDPTALDVVDQALNEGVFGPLIGIAEGLGFAPRGMRRQIREEWLATKDRFITHIDPETGEKIEDTGRAIGANAAIIASSLIPILPSGLIGNVAGRIANLTRGGKIAAGAVAGAAEGALIGFGESQALDPEDRAGAQLLATGLGTALGAGGAAVAVRLAKPGRKLTGGPEFAEGSMSRSIAEGKSPYEAIRDRVVMEMFNDKDAISRISKNIGGEGTERAKEVAQMLVNLENRSIVSSKAADAGISNAHNLWSPTRGHFVKGMVPKEITTPSGRVVRGMARVKPWEEVFSDPRLQNYEDPVGDLGKFIAYRRHLAKAQARLEAPPGSQASKRKINDEVTERARQAMIEIRGIYGDTLDASTGRTILDDIADDVRDISHLHLLQLKAAGIINQKQVDDMLADGLDYVPFHRLADELDQMGLTGSGGRRVATTPLRKLSEGLDPDNPVLNPIEELVLQGVRISEMVDNQILKKALVDAFEEFPEAFPSSFGLRSGGSRRVDSLSEDELKRLGAEDDVVGEVYRRIAADPDEGMAVYVPDPKNPGEIVKAVYNAPADLLHATKSIPPEMIGPAMKTARAFTATLRAGALFTVQFGVRNLLRDPQSSSAMSLNGMLPFVSPAVTVMRHLAAKAGVGAKSWEAVLDSFHRSGVMGSVLTAADRSGPRGREAVKKILEESSHSIPYKLFQRTTRSKLYPLHILTDFSEEATRLTETRLSLRGGLGRSLEKALRGETPISDAIQSGVSKIKSKSPVLGSVTPQLGTRRPKNPLTGAAESAEVNLNFARHGRLGKKWNMLEPFANAELQDFSLFTRRLSNKETMLPTLLKGFAVYTVPALTNYYMNHDDPDYWERPQWERDVFFHIGKREDGSFRKFPRPIGVMNVALGLLPEALLRQLHHDDPKAFESLKSGFVEQTTPGLAASPLLDGGRRLRSAVTPQIVQPAVEAIGNEDWFREQRIIPRRLEDEPKEEQKLPSTSKVAELISAPFSRENLILGAPAKVQHLIDGYLGTMGRDTARLIDMALLGVRPGDTAGDPRRPPIQKIPFIGGVHRMAVTGPTPYGFESQSVDDLYELRDSARLGAKRLEKISDPVLLKELKIHQPEALLVGAVEEATRFLANMAALRREIEDLEGITPEERNDRLVRIDQVVSTTSAVWMENLTSAMNDIRLREQGLMP